LCLAQKIATLLAYGAVIFLAGFAGKQAVGYRASKRRHIGPRVGPGCLKTAGWITIGSIGLVSASSFGTSRFRIMVSNVYLMMFMGKLKGFTSPWRDE
jgi:hypothetical protein